MSDDPSSRSLPPGSWGPWRAKIIKRERAERRYLPNLILFLALLVFGSSWYALHLEHAEQTLFVTLPLSIWTIWNLVQPYLSDAGLNRASLAKRWLTHPQATETLALALTFVGVLFLTTSSVYVEYARGAEHAEYEIEVWLGDQLLLEPGTITSYEPVYGKPFFFGFGRFYSNQPVRVRVVRPFGFEELPCGPLKPWTALNVKTPDCFQRKSYHVCRLVPRGGLINLRPRVNPADESLYSLRLRVTRPGEAEPETYQFDNLLYECIYVGADREVMQAKLRAEPESARYHQIHNALVPLIDPAQGITSDVVRVRTEVLQAVPRWQPTRELQPGDQLSIALSTDKGNNWTLPVAATVGTHNGIQTIAYDLES